MTDCLDNPAGIPAGLLKTDVSPVLPLQKQNLLVGFQSNSSTNVDNRLYPDCVTNQGQIGYVTVCTPVVLTGGQVQIQIRKFTERWRDVHEDDDWRCLVGTTQSGRLQNIKLVSLCYMIAYVFKLRLKGSRTIFPKREGDVTMLLITVNNMPMYACVDRESID